MGPTFLLVSHQSLGVVMPRGTFQIVDWSNYATWHFPIGPRDGDDRHVALSKSLICPTMPRGTFPLGPRDGDDRHVALSKSLISPTMPRGTFPLGPGDGDARTHARTDPATDIATRLR